MNTLDTLTEYLLQHARTVTCAESCTGGLLAAEFTRTSGSSAWFDMGFVTYSNAAKAQLLGVHEATLAFYGAVSEEVVREMAIGALLAAKADYALSISGIAGPGGGSAAKPVGTVWFGWTLPGRSWTEMRRFDGDRASVRRQTRDHALAVLLDALR